MERTEITRQEFIERYGYVPAPDVIGVCFTSLDGRAVVTEFVFTDAVILSPRARYEIGLLERLYAL